MAENMYKKSISKFKEVSPAEADRLLEEKEGHIVYIGRETCPYCYRFVRKLGPLAEENNLAINYVNSEHPDYEEEINEFRKKYNISTVPGFLYSSETAGLTVICDSSIPPIKILQIVEAV